MHGEVARRTWVGAERAEGRRQAGVHTRKHRMARSPDRSSERAVCGAVLSLSGASLWGVCVSAGRISREGEEMHTHAYCIVYTVRCLLRLKDQTRQNKE